MPPSKTAKTVPKSFRIDESALRAVEAEAASLSVSPNTLVNQILKQYAEFDRFARKINTVKISSAPFRGLLSATNVDQLIEVAKSAGSSIPQAFVTAKHGKIDLGSLINHVRSLATYAQLFEFSETFDPHGHVVTLIHDYGLNWSIFLVHYISAMLEQIGVSPKLEMSDRSVIFTLSNQ
ncbi:MAG: hypothetical protein ABSF82_09425 [Candidatus Bathyarchaeia archaeon]|jgi:hypothetical protein